MANIPKKSILGHIWQLGWFGMVQNTAAGCGNDLPMFLRSDMLLLKSRSVYNYFLSRLSFFRELLKSRSVNYSVMSQFCFCCRMWTAYYRGYY